MKISKKQEILNIVKPENGIETAIINNIDFVEGAFWGKVRPGHPEARIILHIKEVLENIDKFYNEDDDDRTNLRIIALIHDTFKYKVDRNKPKTGANHHGMIARIFAEKFTQDQKVLKIIELHDEAYNSWGKGNRRGDWYGAERRAKILIDNLTKIDALKSYVKFYKCDNATGDKERENYNWFINLIT